jgi:hypothetical protein
VKSLIPNFACSLLEPSPRCELGLTLVIFDAMHVFTFPSVMEQAVGVSLLCLVFCF